MTVMEQRAAYADLEPVWTGALERAGQAPGLSSYPGPSSMMLFIDEGPELLTRSEAGRTPPFKLTPKQRENVTEHILRGVSYRSIADKLKVPMSTVVSVSRRVKPMRGQGRRSDLR